MSLISVGKVILFGDDELHHSIRRVPLQNLRESYFAMGFAVDLKHCITTGEHK